MSASDSNAPGDIKDIIQKLVKKTTDVGGDAEKTTSNFLDIQESDDGELASFNELKSKMDGEFIKNSFQADRYRDALTEYILQCNQLKAMSDSESLSATVSDNGDISGENRFLDGHSIHSDDNLDRVHGSRFSPIEKYELLKQRDLSLNDAYEVHEINILPKEYEDFAPLREISMDIPNISNLKLYGTNENGNYVDDKSKVFTQNQASDFYDDFEEGACALPKRQSLYDGNDLLDTEVKETIKQTTPQGSEDGCDGATRTHDNKVEQPPKEKLPVFPKFVYFDVRGIGEPLRYLFAYCKVTYHDVRITREEWDDIKNSMPLCQIPLLLIGDKILQHATPIARYLGILGNIAGDTALEILEVDSLVETLNDLRYQVLQAYFELDKRLKRRKVRTVRMETVPCYMKTLEKYVLDNDGFLVLRRMTWADIFFVGLIEFLSFVSEYDLLDGYPGLRRHCHMIHNLDGIRNWVNIRPQTDA